MEKLLKVLFAISLFGVVSCNTSVLEDVSNENAVITEIQTITDLKNLNAEILTGHLGTRAWSTEEKINVTRRDVQGAKAGEKIGNRIGRDIGRAFGNPITGAAFGRFIGAVTGAALSSWLAAPETRNDGLDVIDQKCLHIMNYCNYLISDELTLTKPGGFVGDTTLNFKLVPNDSLIKRVKLKQEDLAKGELHNLLLSSARGEWELDTSGILMNKTDAIRIELMKSKELSDSCASLAVSIALDEYDDDEVANQVIELFNDVCQQYVSTTSDVVFIINKYIDVIEAASDLTEEDKESIRGALSTALYSFNYWDQTIEQ